MDLQIALFIPRKNELESNHELICPHPARFHTRWCCTPNCCTGLGFCLAWQGFILRQLSHDLTAPVSLRLQDSAGTFLPSDKAGENSVLHFQSVDIVPRRFRVATFTLLCSFSTTMVSSTRRASLASVLAFVVVAYAVASGKGWDWLEAAALSICIPAGSAPVPISCTCVRERNVNGCERPGLSIFLYEWCYDTGPQWYFVVWAVVWGVQTRCLSRSFIMGIHTHSCFSKHRLLGYQDSLQSSARLWNVFVALVWRKHLMHVKRVSNDTRSMKRFVLRVLNVWTL